MIPPAAINDANSRELIRVWAAGGQQHVSLAADAWEDPAVWGIVLADLARHAAEAYRQTKGLDPEKTAARIKALLDAEWSKPTDEPTGNIINE
ncbi:MAG TPA: DUF5076 domain-containing protein [Pirellulales bacterium]|nr:DUF5076 domain-containing protein [Pirellulales bacterium]